VLQNSTAEQKHNMGNKIDAAKKEKKKTSKEERLAKKARIAKKKRGEDSDPEDL